MGLKNITTSLILLLFFVFLIYNFSYNFINTTNPDSEVLNSKYGLNSSIGNLSNSIDKVSNLSQGLYRDGDKLGTPEPSATDFLFLIFKGAFYIPLAFASVLYTSFLTITTILFPTLGGTGMGSLIATGLSLLVAGFLIKVVLVILKAIRTGETEG